MACSLANFEPMFRVPQPTSTSSWYSWSEFGFYFHLVLYQLASYDLTNPYFNLLKVFFQ